MNTLAVQERAPTIEERIEGKIDKGIAGSLAINDSAGGLAFANVEQVMEFAKMMSVAQIAIPKHLRGNPGACLGVCIQAVEWRMSPFAVANKSYSVNDRLAYEAQLIQAVILQRAPIKGRLKVEYTGTGENRVCRVWAELREQDGGGIVEYVSPLFGRITPKNSPLWKTDPDQQLFYYSARSLARRHFPDVILGVYARDEIEDSRPAHVGPDRAKDVTPLAERLAARAVPSEGFNPAFVEAETSGADPVETIDHETGEVMQGDAPAAEIDAPAVEPPAPDLPEDDSFPGDLPSRSARSRGNS